MTICKAAVSSVNGSTAREPISCHCIMFMYFNVLLKVINKYLLTLCVTLSFLTLNSLTEIYLTENFIIVQVNIALPRFLHNHGKYATE